MTRYEKMPKHDESRRAPTGVCELSIQSDKNGAPEFRENVRVAVQQYVEQEIDVESFRYEDEALKDRLVMYTGTDRLDIATMRDIAEVYGQITEFGKGNIPPELSLVPTSNGDDSSEYFAWLEFKLKMELPFREVEEQLREKIGTVEIMPKRPVGEKMEAILFRDGNVAGGQIRQIVREANNIKDALPVDGIRVVCEQRGGS